MGAVYLALDTKLGREVALELLPEPFASEPDRLARFAREAQVLAALNHPNIAAIYGVEESALVLELVPGPTLAERIAQGPIPFAEALRVAAQIADALEYAHDRGIVHRDLKPANIKVTPEGRVKVLDFGLAKAMAGPAVAADVKSSPTLTMRQTVAGLILGTAAYMSPEQARGQEVDARADIWAFGVVLLEMLTGRAVFGEPTVSDTLASVLKSEPDLGATPARVRPLIERCLRKDPRARWRNIGDVRLDIEAMLADPRGASVIDPPAGAKPLWKRVVPVAAAAMLSAAIAAAVVWYLKPSPPPEVTRFSIPLAEDQQFTNAGRIVVAISPDGQKVVYVANKQLYLRSLHDLEVRPIAGSADPKGLVNPVFSPDGQFLAYFSQADNTLKRIPVAGGAAVTICATGSPWGMSWDGKGIVFAEGSEGILRVSASGGKPETIVTMKNNEIAAHPQMLPGGATVLFTIFTNIADKSQSRIVVQTLESGSRKVVVEQGAAARYLPGGQLVYATSGTLMAVTFDVNRLEKTGAEAPVIEGVARSADLVGAAPAQFVFSQSSSLAYIPGPADPNGSYSMLGVAEMANATQSARVQSLNLPGAGYSYPRASPDGKRVAYEIDEKGESSIWTYELSGTTAPRRLTLQGVNRYPVWSGDGQRIAFQSNRDGDEAIFWQRADGAGQAERLTKPETGISHTPESWSPDGGRLIFTATQGAKVSLWVLSLRDNKISPFITGDHLRSESSAFSPDGKWLAYTASSTRAASGYNCFVQPFPPDGTIYPIARAIHPLWSRDGRRLSYAEGPAQWSAVTVATGKTFRFSNPEPAPRHEFTGKFEGPRNYDSLPGDRVVGVLPYGGAKAGDARQIVVVSNWFEDVRRRLAGR